MSSLLERRIVKREKPVLEDEKEFEKLILSDKDTNYELNSFPFLIGREEKCDVWINQKTVSRQHAQIVIENDEFYLEDLGSVSGTFLNNQQIEASKKYPIGVNDTILIADYSLEVRKYEVGLEDNEQVEEKDISNSDSEGRKEELQEVNGISLTDSVNINENSSDESQDEIINETVSKKTEDILDEMIDISESDEETDKIQTAQETEMTAEADDETAFSQEKENISDNTETVEIESIQMALNCLIKDYSMEEEQIAFLKEAICLSLKVDGKWEQTVMSHIDELVLESMPPRLEKPVKTDEEASDYTTMIGIKPVVEGQPVPTQRRVIRREAETIRRSEESVSPINPYHTSVQARNFETAENKFKNYDNCPILYPVMIDGERVEIPIFKTPFTIGKSVQNSDFQLMAKGISRAHCLITFHNGNYFISDLESTNGVFVNRKKIKAHKESKIKSGDKITLGVNQFVFEIPR